MTFIMISPGITELAMRHSQVRINIHYCHAAMRSFAASPGAAPRFWHRPLLPVMQRYGQLAAAPDLRDGIPLPTSVYRLLTR